MLEEDIRKEEEKKLISGLCYLFIFLIILICKRLNNFKYLQFFKLYQSYEIIHSKVYQLIFLLFKLIN